jgi:hypothetical protein
MSQFPFDRRSMLGWTVAAGLVGSALPIGRAEEGLQGFDANVAEQMLDLNTVELRIQLQNGLRLFLPEQQDFLDQVLAAVDNGQLPRAMVNMVYVWSLRRNRKFPFPYFEVAMRALAERRGVTL